MSEFNSIPESVSPEGLMARAEIMRATDPSCARHLELAAEEIKKLRGQPGKKSVEDEEQATRYVTASSQKLKAGTLTLYRKDQVLGFLIMRVEEVYSLGSHLLHMYDKLEGIQ
jgi:hypothetical protein